MLKTTFKRRTFPFFADFLHAHINLVDLAMIDLAMPVPRNAEQGMHELADHWFDDCG